MYTYNRLGIPPSWGRSMIWPGVAAFWYLPETVEVVFGCWVVEGFIVVHKGCLVGDAGWG